MSSSASAMPTEVRTARCSSRALGLSVHVSTPVRELLSGDLEVNIAEWDRSHRVDAREARQATPFLRRVIEALRPPPSIVRWTDDEMVLEYKITRAEADVLD